MRLKYVLYSTDESFDYNDYGGTIEKYEDHGFEIEINSEGFDINSLHGFGHLEGIEKKYRSLERLQVFIKDMFVFLDDKTQLKIKDLYEMINFDLDYKGGLR